MPWICLKNGNHSFDANTRDGYCPKCSNYAGILTDETESVIRIDQLFERIGSRDQGAPSVAPSTPGANDTLRLEFSRLKADFDQVNQKLLAATQENERLTRLSTQKNSLADKYYRDIETLKRERDKMVREIERLRNTGSGGNWWQTIPPVWRKFLHIDNSPDNVVSDSVSRIRRLEIMDDREFRFVSLSPLEFLPQLTELIVTDQPLTDVKPLQKLVNLFRLVLDDTTIQSIAPLGDLVNLEILSIGNTRVSDISPLGKLTKLKTLVLRNSPVNDFQIIGTLENLEILDISGTQAGSLDMLSNCKKLNTLCYSDSTIKKEEILRYKQLNPQCTLILNN